jgi:electron transfer flavoprotein beta subunit
VAQQIAHFAKAGGYDLILMGRESIDFNGGMVHGMVGELLGIPSFSPVMKLELEGTTVKMAREIEGGKEHLEAQLPLIAGCQEPIAEWNMRGIMSARTKPLVVVEPVSQETQAEASGYLLPPAKGSVKLVDKDQVSELVRLLKNEAKVL